MKDRLATLAIWTGALVVFIPLVAGHRLRPFQGRVR